MAKRKKKIGSKEVTSDHNQNLPHPEPRSLADLFQVHRGIIQEKSIPAVTEYLNETGKASKKGNDI